MKKLLLFSLILTPFIAFGALKAQDIQWYDYIAQIHTQNSGNVFINKVVDGDKTCYVMTSDSSKYGPQMGISCVANAIK